jgi:hypothetical protein
MRRDIPSLELAKRLRESGIASLSITFEAAKTGLGNIGKPGKERRVAFVRPIKLRAQNSKSRSLRLLCGLKAGDRISDRPHQIEPAKGESPFPFERRNARDRLAAKLSFRGGGAISCPAKFIDKESAQLLAPCERGGREWESNPPKTGSRPLPDLKSGRPTGDESLPC